MNKPLSRWWLLIGTAALAIAGLFSLVLVVARAPVFKAMGLDHLFHEALVVHVDLSVLVWFLAIACLLWSVMTAGTKQLFPYLEEAALICFALGTLGITLSPLDPHAVALMSNYIPVITSPVFFLGLSLLFIGVALMLVKLFSSPAQGSMFNGAQRFGLFTAGLIALMSAMAFIWSHQQMPPVIDGQQYYEMAFWGGGHVLQFLHTQLLLVVWLVLMRTLSSPSPLVGEGGMEGNSPQPQAFLYFLFSIGLIAVLLTPLAYLLYDVASMEHRQFFTWQMIIANGIAPTILSLALIPSLWNSRNTRKSNRRALWAALLMSVLLFLYGGVLGLLIEGQNVVIPAHYHGSIVGVTLAFMGAAYWLLPHFDYRDASGWRLAFWQPIVYGVGQIMHISGLAWSGGYGVLRKTPGGLEAADAGARAAMGFMGLGGLLAIIGGFMFVVVIARAVLCHPERSEGSVS